VNNRASDRQFLLHAQRVTFNIVVQSICQSDDFTDLSSSVAQFRAFYVVQSTEICEVLSTAQSPVDRTFTMIETPGITRTSDDGIFTS